jgi:hypothetical protein
MHISEFLSNYKNHPILFVGTGLSLRYLKHSYTWDGLLEHIVKEYGETEEHYLDIKAMNQTNGRFNFQKVASVIEGEFNDFTSRNRHGKFEKLNDLFYDYMRKGENVSRFKLFISQIFENYDLIEEKAQEIAELKKIRKNIGSVITTNYDSLIEDIFGFEPLIGNNILLSNPYGSVYKIHGSVGHPQDIIISEEDYSLFDSKYELIRAQLLSLFIHNPIIFIGYGIGDDNIKKILKTIFTYVEPNTEIAQKIRDNFLLIEYCIGSPNLNVVEHDIDIAEINTTIRINKLKTDDFLTVYKLLGELNLPISAMDIRKVQSIVKKIYAGGKDSCGQITVHITENIDDLENSQTILAIGSPKTIQYRYLNVKDFIKSYFNIIEEANAPMIMAIDQLQIAETQYFPIFGFLKITDKISCKSRLQRIECANLNGFLSTSSGVPNNHTSIDDIFSDSSIGSSYKHRTIMKNVLNGKISVVALGTYLKENIQTDTNYRKLLCMYDILAYSNSFKRDKKGAITILQIKEK